MEYVDAAYKNFRFPVHFHDTFVIQHVSQGVDWCCGNELEAKSGQVFIHTPGAAHTGGTAQDHTLRYQAIYPSSHLLEELTGIRHEEISRRQTWILDRPVATRRIRRLLEKFGAHCETTSSEQAPSERQSKRLLKTVFETLLDNLPDLAIAREENRETPILHKMQQAHDYLVLHAERDVTTDELSAACELSPFHLIRSFRNCFGITPRQFLLSQRIARAKQLIASGSTVASAAHACGFADQSHLCRYFKRVTGYQPSRLRVS